MSKVCNVLLERNSSPDVISPRPLFTSLDTGAEIIFAPLRIGSENGYYCLPPKHLDVAKKLEVFPVFNYVTLHDTRWKRPITFMLSLF